MRLFWKPERPTDDLGRARLSDMRKKPNACTAVEERPFQGRVSHMEWVWALQLAEKLAFGWRSALSAAIKRFFSIRALATEGRFLQRN